MAVGYEPCHQDFISKLNNTSMAERHGIARLTAHDSQLDSNPLRAAHLSRRTWPEMSPKLTVEDVERSRAFLQNKFQCPSMVGARRT